MTSYRFQVGAWLSPQAQIFFPFPRRWPHCATGCARGIALALGRTGTRGTRCRTALRVRLRGRSVRPANGDAQDKWSPRGGRSMCVHLRLVDRTQHPCGTCSPVVSGLFAEPSLTPHGNAKEPQIRTFTGFRAMVRPVAFSWFLCPPIAVKPTHDRKPPRSSPDIEEAIKPPD